MHVDSLKYFIEIAKEKSISKTAKKQHITQSALSQLIQKLEEDFGYKLLKRSNKGVELTKMGEIVLKYSKNIIINYNRMIDELMLHEKKTTKIHINGTWSLVAYSLPCVIYAMKKKFVSHNYELKAENFEQTVMEIQNDICDFAFVENEVDPSLGLQTTKMGREKIVLIAPNKSNFKDSIELKELVNIEVILCTSNAKACQILTNILGEIGESIEDLNTVFNVDSVSAAISSVSNGYGMAFVPYEAVKHEVYEKNVKIVDIKGIKLEYNIYLLSKKREHLPRKTKEAIDYLVKNGRKSFC